MEYHQNSESEKYEEVDSLLDSCENQDLRVGLEVLVELHISICDVPGPELVWF